MIDRPADSEYAPFYRGYVALVTESDLIGVLASQGEELRRFAGGVARERETFAYGPGKWTVRQVLGHLVDAERVFGYRAFCLGRGEAASLPGFDENAYVTRSNSAQRAVADLADEFAAVRQANVVALRQIDDAGWRHVGTANGKPISTRALGFVMAGHVRHHLNVLREKYGVPAA